MAPEQSPGLSYVIPQSVSHGRPERWPQAEAGNRTAGDCTLASSSLEMNEELCPWQCPLPASVPRDTEELRSQVLTSEERNCRTYPFAVPTIQAGYILEGDLFVMDHQRSLWRQRQKPSTPTLREAERQEGTDSLPVPKREHFTKSELSPTGA